MEALRELFKKFEFTRLIKEFTIEKREDKNYSWITDLDEIKSLFEELKKQGSFALDFETTSEFPMQAQIVGISFAYEDHKGLLYTDCP